MPRVKLVLEYDGTNYVGWQVQANGPSIHLRVQEALEARGRTHQPLRSRPNGLEGPRQGQVVAFDSPCQLPLKAYRLGLNSLLPDDIAGSAEAVADDFDRAEGAKVSVTATLSATTLRARHFADTPTGRSFSSSSFPQWQRAPDTW